MTRDATTAFARALVDEWARAGVHEACVAPGSRSAPLALALAADDRIRVHVHLDERSAAFFALGTAKASGSPAVVLCTSGTAAANFHPAVLEASHARTPLIVCTADRPPELRDTGAGQTVDQLDLYGRAVRWFCEVGVPGDHPGAGTSWRSIAARAVAESVGPPAGPVHLNLAFREPLVPTGAPLVDAPGRPDGRPWTSVTRPTRVPDEATVARIAAAVRAQPRGLIVAGWGSDASAGAVDRFAAAAGWPVLADPISGLRQGPHAVSTYEALLRSPGFAERHRPELVLRLGAAPTSKPLTAWLGPEVPQLLVDPDAAWLDPGRGVAERLAVDADPLFEALAAALGRPAEHRSEWQRRMARRRARGARRARRPPRRVGGVVRGSCRARHRRRAARRRHDGRGVQHAGARCRSVRPTACGRALSRQPRRQRHRRVRLDRAGSRGRLIRTDGRAARRPVSPARRQRSPRRGRPWRRCHLRRARQRRRGHLLVSPAGGAARPLRIAVRHAPRRRSRRPGLDARPPGATGSRRRARWFPPSRPPSPPGASGS